MQIHTPHTRTRRMAVGAMGTALMLSFMAVTPSLASDQSAPADRPSPTGAAIPTASAPPGPITPNQQQSARPAGSVPPPPYVDSTPLSPKSDQQKNAMRQSVGFGGAEMGQRSKRVLDEKRPVSGLTAGSRNVPGLIPTATDPNHWQPGYGVQGQDVSAWQTNVDWSAQWNMGSRFAYVKASEGDYYASSTFTTQYQGSRNVGMYHGAYHFAIPNWSSGSAQAQYFVANGGNWSADGATLPPALDIEYNPYQGRTINGWNAGNVCYDMSPSQLSSWIHQFGDKIQALTGRYPVIYSTTDWWQTCLGSDSTFGDYPLWIAAYPNTPSGAPGTLPASWNQFSFWQYSSTGPFDGDSNVWNGGLAQLDMMANAWDRPSISMPTDATPVTGRWWGDGKTYAGWTKGGLWCLQQQASQPYCFWYGNSGDKPVTGDWNGDGIDTPGVVRNGVWYLTNSIYARGVDMEIIYGNPTDTPVTGDWNGVGATKIGVFRNGLWQLSGAMTRYPTVAYGFVYGNPGDVPVTGAWTGGKVWGVGVVRNAWFYLTNDGTRVSNAFEYGLIGDTPVVGDWDGVGGATAGIVRAGTWQLTNSNITRQVNITFH